MNKLNPIKYIENMISHHPKSLSLWITEGIVIDGKRYIIKEFRLRDGSLYAVIAENKYTPKYFEVKLAPDEETLKDIYQAIKDNKIAIEQEITDRKNEISRVDSAIKANTTKINQEITDRKNEINRVDKKVEANTAKINQEITDRQNDISRVNEAISANTAKINKEITDRQNEISRVDGKIEANTAKINKEITERQNEISRVDNAIAANTEKINQEIADRTDEINRVNESIESNTTKINQEITDRRNEISRVDSAIKANTTKINQEITDRKNEINRVDKKVEANTAKINQEITDRTNEITRVDGDISTLTAKIDKEIVDRTNEITRVDEAINANTAKIDKEIKDRKNEITRVDGAINANTEKINQEITDRTNEINRVDNKITALEDKSTTTDGQIAALDKATKDNKSKIDQEIANRRDEINRVDEAIEANTAKINKEIQDRQNEISRVDGAVNANTAKINKEIQDRQNEINRVDGAIEANTTKINKEITDRKDEITRVEGKIPTSVGGRNLAQKTSKDWSKPFTNFKGTENTCPDLYKVLVDGISVGDTLKSRIVLKYTDIRPASGKTAKIWLHGTGNVTGWGGGSYNVSPWKTISGSGEVVIEHEFKITADHLKNSYWNMAFRTDWIASGSLQWKLAKVERGMFFTDWSPAPEDYDSKLDSVKSEIKQTTDAIKASVSSVQTAASNAQSTANTAVTKADTAQSTANSNKQTISTLNSSLAQKQDKLTAGTGIAIQGNVISATGSSTPQHDTQKEQLLESTRSTITIGHGANGTSETTKVDTNPTKVLEHENLLTDYGISKNTTGNTTKLGLEYTLVPDGFDLNTLKSCNIRGSKLTNAPSNNGAYFIQSFGNTKGDNIIQTAFKRVHSHSESSNIFRRYKINNSWGDWREQVGDKSVIDTAISANTTKINQEIQDRKNEITRVEGKIPTSIGVRNLWIQSKVTGNFIEETLPDNHITGQKKCYRIQNYQQLYFNIEPDFSPRLYQKVTFSAWVKYDNVVQGNNDWNKFNCFKHELYYKNSSTGATTNVNHLTLEGFTGTSDWKHITYTYDYSANKSYDQLKTSIKFNLEDTKSGTAWVTGVKIELGSIPSDYTLAPEDYDSKLTSVKSEIKQTTDAISARVTTLDSSTVKNSSLTINEDGTVMKAGKTTTDIANAIGSYFAVNQNAINKFSDRINVKTAMIADGAVTSAKIAREITLDTLTCGKLNNTNGVTAFDLNTGTLKFTNNSGRIQRAYRDKVIEITDYITSTSGAQDYATSAFVVRKSDNSKQAAVKLTLDNTKAEATITSDLFHISDSNSKMLFSVDRTNNVVSDWGDIPIAHVLGGLVANDISIGGRSKSLLKIIDELCKKASITWF